MTTENKAITDLRNELVRILADSFVTGDTTEMDNLFKDMVALSLELKAATELARTL